MSDLDTKRYRVRLLTPTYSFPSSLSSKELNINEYSPDESTQRRERDEIRRTDCLTWEQRAEFGKVLVRVSSKITTERTTVLPEGLFLTASAGLCEILVMKFSALGKQLLSRFVTSLKFSSASSKRVKNFQGNVG